jgi:Xaa-Pro dipeptidase
MSELGTHYADHLNYVKKLTDMALQRANCSAVVIASGAEKYQFLDDRPVLFAANPHFKHWLPLTEHPHCWIAYTPGSKPKLIYFQPKDYWHVVPQAPSGYWVEHFDIHVIRETHEALALLPKPGPTVVVVGEDNAGVVGYEPNIPDAYLNYMHFHRAFKSDYELDCMRFAQTRAVRGHLAAERAFRNDGSEYDIHMAYLQGLNCVERQLPYGNIIGLNEHCAVLHYQHQRHDKPMQHLSFLIDAGALHLGYCSDITRTYAKHSGLFADMVSAMDHAQLRLCDLARVGATNSHIHIAAHREVAGILHQFKLVNLSAEAIFEKGITHTFFPHGIGHFLGIQVHDVGGYLKDDRGTVEPKPNGYKYLRLTREFSGNEVLTIEPGLYFIDMLLQELKATDNARYIAWSEVDALRHYGGIRIEDNVRVMPGGGAPENLTRAAFAV